MDLWIRSQDREELVKVSQLEIGETDGGYVIVAENLYGFGTYKTKERALEVLDEIQMLLSAPSLFSTDSNYVYQMPKE